MANKKHHKKKSHTPRRRVSGVSHGSKAHLQTLGMGILGGVASTYVNTAIQKRMTKIPANVLSLIQIGLGGAILWKPRPAFITGVGWGMLLPGTLGLGHNVGLLNGIEEMVSGMLDDGNEMNGPEDDNFQYRLSGIDNEMNIAGLSNASVIGMMPETGEMM